MGRVNNCKTRQQRTECPFSQRRSHNRLGGMGVAAFRGGLLLPGQWVFRQCRLCLEPINGARLPSTEEEDEGWFDRHVGARVYMAGFLHTLPGTVVTKCGFALPA